MIELLTGKLWLVWSNEHRAWWGPNNSGYDTDIASAGRYTLEDAQKNCVARSQRKGRNPTELIQPSPEWLTMRQAVIAAQPTEPTR